MANLTKLLIKVLRDDDWKWIHFCYISSDIYDDFFNVIGCEKSEIGGFLSAWAKQDLGISLRMATYQDVLDLRRTISDKYSKEYKELYALKEEENPKIYGWVRFWVSEHMRKEIKDSGGNCYEPRCN